MTSRGVPRVVWRRPKKFEEGVFDSIPFLSVSRSLGDFWSYNPRTNRFTVSPKPDVHVHPLNPKEQRFIVIASDGLWNVMNPDEVVRYIWDYEHNNDECHQPRDVVRAIINEALRRWDRKRLPADNIAVLIAFLTEANLFSCSFNNTNSHSGKQKDASEASPISETEDTIAVRENSPASPSLLAPESSETEVTIAVREGSPVSPLLLAPESSKTEVTFAVRESSPAPASPLLLGLESSETKVTTAVRENSPTPSSPSLIVPKSLAVQDSSPVPTSPSLLAPKSSEIDFTTAVQDSSPVIVFNSSEPSREVRSDRDGSVPGGR